MKKILGIIITIIIIVLVGLGTWGILSSRTDYSLYVSGYYEGGSVSGGIADHVFGNIETAKVVLVEYADFQCSGCANVTPWMEELVDEYDGQLAIVFRNYPIQKHANSRAASAAAEAAGLQGYWQEYAEYLYNNQADWFYTSATARAEQFASYFATVSDGNGDITKFVSDMSSAAVSKKINFNLALGNYIGVEATPTFTYKGDTINWYNNTSKSTIQNFFRDYINERL